MKMRIALAVAALFIAAVAVAADAPPQMSPAQQAMMEKMMKAATPGAQHALLAKMAGEWNCTVKYQTDPSKPAQESQSTAVITTLMDGRYIQEVDAGQMSGMPFSGMGVSGFDNVSGKYVSTWIDNMGTGIMTSVGTADASGKVISWNATMNDPVTGKPAKSRMVTTFIDDNHHTFEMFGVPPGAKKEMKVMTIDYARKGESAAR
ncbi:MAG TPA: DUF1579 domain-containing protein [Candidatus Udaeobacter sp.]|jgi:hypothetical protein|nr:DUF1579 domain-containing protein [Candidatus Udaeobacter sp.]